MNEVVEFRMPVVVDSEIQFDEEKSEVATEVRTGTIMHWGVRTAWDDENKVALTNTVVFVSDAETGTVWELDPNEIRVL